MKTKLQIRNSVTQIIEQVVKKYGDESPRDFYYSLACNDTTIITKAFDIEAHYERPYQFACDEDSKTYYEMVEPLIAFHRAVKDYYVYLEASKSTDGSSYMNPERRRLSAKSKQDAKELYPKVIKHWDKEIVTPMLLVWV